MVLIIVIVSIFLNDFSFLGFKGDRIYFSGRFKQFRMCGMEGEVRKKEGKKEYDLLIN